MSNAAPSSLWLIISPALLLKRGSVEGVRRADRDTKF